MFCIINNVQRLWVYFLIKKKLIDQFWMHEVTVYIKSPFKFQIWGYPC